MKAKDLMLGDYISVKPSGLPIKVAAVHHKKVAYHAVINKLTWVRESLLEPIPLTPEILEKNGFKRDAFTNLSPDFFYEDDACSVSINLNSTCDKHKSIWVTNRNLRITTSIQESRHAFPKKPLLFHQLQHVLRLCGIEKEIEL